MFAVTGATGQLGRLVLAALLQRTAANQVVALVRDPAKAADLAGQGVAVRPFDYDAPERLVEPLAGVTRLLFISSDTPDQRIAQHRAVVDAAARAGVELIAYTSIIHADANPISLAESHRETERAIAASGVPYAILRNGWYNENYLIGAEAAIAHGALLGSTGDGGISGAARADYAEAAAVILTEPLAPNRVYELAGDEAFTLSDVAAALGEASGRTVEYRDLPESGYREALIGAGLPDGFAAALAEYSAKAAGGILADGSRTLSGLIGRPTETIRATVLRALVGASAAGAAR
ncbi:NAD(P)H-binding protein [Sphingomonas sp. AP4-R1]|uniref:NmrA family NAD(P)-binding protein n=1 Tax=Sphingomonas sp. AP4-R1 TaxID=2735134 RepID=UPI0014933637|nr:NAD(P)H-binding protein [Sphingomonas sp. AP4-R1]QJU57161.1 NAD(P)H-binding protein [Sphingomonas sp. AP4-R1]